MTIRILNSTQAEQRIGRQGRPVLPRWMIGPGGLLLLAVLAGLIFSPGGTLIERLQWLDSGICAQLLTHSFYPGGERLPLCARNTGIYLGFLMTLVSLYMRGRGRAQKPPSHRISYILIGCVALLAGDGLNSLLFDLGLPHLYQPQNSLRLATGLLTGLALGCFVLPLFNHWVWQQTNEQRSVTSWRDLAWSLSALVVCFLVVLSQNALTLYPIALLSTAGLVSAITGINALVIITLTRCDECFRRYRQLGPFLLLALLCTPGELLILAQLKLLLLHMLGS